VNLASLVFPKNHQRVTELPWRELKRETYRRLNILGWHLICRGVLLGVNLQFDPQVKPVGPLGVISLVALAILTLSTHSTLQVALAWILVSPAWIYCFATIEDVVFEYRSYATLLGIAGLAAWAAQYQPALVAILVGLYSARTWQRSKAWATSKDFWEQCYRDSPKNPRAILNYAEAIQRTARSAEDFDRAAELYESILDAPHRSAGTAAANLSVIYIWRSGRGDGEYWMTRTADMLDVAAERWPWNATLCHNRGLFFQWLAPSLDTPEETTAMYEQAIQEYSLALRANQEYAPAYRQRAYCLRKIDRWPEGDRDEETAYQIDGFRGRR
jgi:tetratricopeptide (TPR) repeat protein